GAGHLPQVHEVLRPQRSRVGSAAAAQGALTADGRQGGQVMGMTVLVSGGGGAAAISTIKSLRLGGFDGRIVSVDAEPLSAGLYLADGFRVVPKAKDPEFLPAVKRLIEEEHVDVIFPTSGFDI